MLIAFQNMNKFSSELKEIRLKITALALDTGRQNTKGPLVTWYQW